MQSLLEIVLSNSAIATLLAVVAIIVGRRCRRPSLVYGLWLLVLLKLVTPSFVRIPVAFLGQERSAELPAANLDESPHEPAARFEGMSSNVYSKSRVAAPREADARGKRDGKSDSNGSGTPSISSSHTAARAVAASSGEIIESARPASRPVGGKNSADSPRSNRSFSWARMLLAVWAAGTIASLLVTLARVVRFGRQIHRLWPTEAHLQRAADNLARRFGLSRSPRVKVVNASLPPMLWAVQHPPVIFLPRALVERLTPEQTLTLLAHELAHFRRRDHWVRWLEVLVVGVYWWHPVAWIARRQLHRCEEECCDAWVIWVLPDAAATYARTILATVDFLTADFRPSPALASGLGPVHALERRFEMILHTQPAHRVGSIAKGALMLLALVVLPLSARAQISAESVKPAVLEVQTPKTPAQRRLPDPTLELTTKPLAVAGATEEAAPVDPRFPGSQANATPAAIGRGSSSSNDTEDRLARLEKMVQMIVAEMHGQQHKNYDSPFSNNKLGSSNGPGGGVESLSLSDLKKQRIDLEDELEKIKDQMDKVDEQIAKLQSARSLNHPHNESRQAK
jgi:beta-lactamase regulating signal transducer with metallopeptidase domain